MITRYKNLSEQINRMKSLFNEERLYGNLIKEEYNINIHKQQIDKITLMGSKKTKNNSTPIYIGKPPQPIEEIKDELGSISVTGIRASGNKIVIDAYVSLLFGAQKSASQTLGSLNKTETGYVWEPNKNTWKSFEEKASQDQKDLFNSFISAITNDVYFGNAVMLALKGDKDVGGAQLMENAKRAKVAGVGATGTGEETEQPESDSFIVDGEVLWRIYDKETKKIKFCVDQECTFERETADNTELEKAYQKSHKAREEYDKRERERKKQPFKNPYNKEETIYRSPVDVGTGGEVIEYFKGEGAGILMMTQDSDKEATNYEPTLEKAYQDQLKGKDEEQITTEKGSNPIDKYKEAGFDTAEQGNLFRQWVNTNKTILAAVEKALAGPPKVGDGKLSRSSASKDGHKNVYITTALKAPLEGGGTVGDRYANIGGLVEDNAQRSMTLNFNRILGVGFPNEKVEVGKPNEGVITGINTMLNYLKKEDTPDAIKKKVNTYLADKGGVDALKKSAGDSDLAKGVWKLVGKGILGLPSEEVISVEETKVGCEGDCENGTGTKGYDNGDKYEGSWKDGIMAIGTYTWANGDRYVGEWKASDDGLMKVWNGELIPADGKKVIGVINGKKTYKDEEDKPPTEIKKNENDKAGEGETYEDFMERTDQTIKDGDENIGKAWIEVDDRGTYGWGTPPEETPEPEETDDAQLDALTAMLAELDDEKKLDQDANNVAGETCKKRITQYALLHEKGASLEDIVKGSNGTIKSENDLKTYISGCMANFGKDLGDIDYIDQLISDGNINYTPATNSKKIPLLSKWDRRIGYMKKVGGKENEWGVRGKKSEPLVTHDGKLYQKAINDIINSLKKAGVPVRKISPIGKLTNKNKDRFTFRVIP